MLHFLLILSAIFAISIATETIKQLETIKESLDKQETVFSEVLSKAEAASNKKYGELAEKFKQFEEQCKTLDTLMRTEFGKPNLLVNLYPARKFSMDAIFKEETICDDFLKLDPHMRFERDSHYHQLFQLGNRLDGIEKITNVKSEEMQMLSGLKEKRIRLPIERYDKIGETLHEVEKSFETLQNGNEEDDIHTKESFIKECEALKELIMERIHSKDRVLTEMKFLDVVYLDCKEILEPNVDEKEIEEFKELLQEMKEMVGCETHLKLPKDAKEKLILETAENLIETYGTIEKANAKLKNTLQECRDLYDHVDINAAIQIKYFAELTKIGQKFVENLKKYFNHGQPADQFKEALKAEKDELVKKLTFDIRYNGKSEWYFGVPLLEHFTMVENRKGILDLIKKNLILSEILVAEKEIILNAEYTTMVNAFQVLKIYKQKIDAIHEEKKLAENSPTSSNGK